MKTLLTVFLSIGLSATAVYASEPQHKLRWVLAHEPARVFERAAKHFAQTVQTKSDGKIQVEIIYGESLNNGQPLSADRAFHMVQKGQLEMSQTYTTALGKYNKDLWILDLPFLFRDHGHAAKVLDGEIGHQILAGLEAKGVKGLGFTYSGGFRIIPTKDKELTAMSDFKGQKIRVVSDSPIAFAYLKELGAKPIQTEDQGAYKKGLDGYETTYARLENVKENESKFINETEHSLFLTTILINKDFYNRLSPDLQKILNESAKEAARLERQDSIQDGLTAKEKYQAVGLKVVHLSAPEKEKMKKVAEKIYKKYDSFFSKGMISKIQQVI